VDTFGRAERLAVALPQVSQQIAFPLESCARWSDMMDEEEGKDDAASLGSEETAVPSSASDDCSSEDDTGRTTLMISGLPTEVTRSKLLQLLVAEGLGEACDFLYVPVDFRQPTKGAGYGFANFVSEQAALRAQQKLHSAHGFEVAFSEKQGLDLHVERFRNSPVMHWKVPDEAKPALFVAGSRVAFPRPTRHICAPRLKRS
jgi:RNA recognition motif-containing protein